MKKYFILLLSCFITSICMSQQCYSDKLLDKQKEIDPSLESRILNIISNLNKGEKEFKMLNKNSSWTIKIPVVFNIIHNGEPVGIGRNLSDAKIQEQINILNESYSGVYGGVDSSIRFCLANQDVFGTGTSGVYRYYEPQSFFDITSFCGTDSEQMDFGTDFFIKSHRDSAKFPELLYLNVWIADIKSCGSDGILGYSSFPFTLGDSSDNIIDGVVLDYETVGNNDNTSTGFVSEGKTMVHEVGHWLGLFHTFQGFADDDSYYCLNTSPCETTGDLICDTEAVPAPATLLNDIQEGAHDSENCMGLDCNFQPSDALQNYMDYADDSCMKKFTLGQRTRIRDLLLFHRTAIFNQGIQNSSYCGGPTASGGSGGTICMNTPSDIESHYISPNPNSSFGHTIDADDTWLITIDEDNDNLLVYKKIGCTYVLHQVIDTPFDISIFHYSLRPKARYYRNDIILRNDEMIVSSFVNDSVKIFKYDDVTDLWVLNQSIYNATGNTRVGSGIKTIDNFLFILEYNQQSNNSIRIYRKEPDGMYVYHQTLTSSSIDFPSLSKCIVSKNTIDTNININSPHFTGIYNPTEVILAEYQNDSSGNKVALLGLNSSYNWVIKGIQTLPSHIKNIHDIGASERFFYIVANADNNNGQYQHSTQAHMFYLSSNSTIPINNTSLSSVVSLYNTSIGNSGEITQTCDFKILGRDEFFLYNHLYWYFRGTGIVSNSNPISSNTLPNFSKVTEEYGNDEISMCYTFKKINGNTMFSRSAGQIRIYNLKDAFEAAGYDDSNVESIFSREICSVPNNFLTIANQISIGGSCDVSFNYEHKEFKASEEITISNGTSINMGSEITLQVDNDFSNCSFSLTDDNDSINVKESYKRQSSSIEEVNSSSNDDTKITIYPNPTSGLLTITNITQKNVKQLEIYNLTNPSNILFSVQNLLSKESLSLDLSRYNTGVYVIRIILDNGEIIYKKIIRK